MVPNGQMVEDYSVDFSPPSASNLIRMDIACHFKPERRPTRQSPARVHNEHENLTPADQGALTCYPTSGRSMKPATLLSRCNVKQRNAHNTYRTSEIMRK